MSNSKEWLQFINDWKIKTNKRENIEFYDHKFLFDILKDESKIIVVKKCVQAGVSFTFELKAIKKGIENAINVIYVLPSMKDARDFVVSKFDPVMENSNLKQMVRKTELSRTNVWSSALKKIGDSYFFFRGAQSETSAQSIDADMVINDEYDFQPATSRKMFQERLEGSGSKGINYCIGYPIIKNGGIAEMFNESDAKEWFITCPHCKKRQILTWPNNIDIENKNYICSECKGVLSDNDRRNGIWIGTKRTNSGISGYHISKMMLPWVTAESLIKKFKNDAPKHFFNYSLGLEYESSNKTITKEEFEAVQISQLKVGRYKGEHSYRVIGIDQGNRFHYCEGYVSPRGALATNITVFDDEKDLKNAIRNFKPDKLVIDMSPNRWSAIQIQDEIGRDIVYLANIRLWALDKIAKSNIKYFELKRESGIINIERTESIDELFNALKKKELLLLKGIPTLEDVYIHLTNMVPVNELRQGIPRKVYKRAGSDDYGFALNLFSVAAKLLIPDPNEYLKDLSSKKQENIPVGLEKAIEKMLIGYEDNVVLIKPKK